MNTHGEFAKAKRYRSLAGFRTTFFWVILAPFSTLVHFDNPTCDKCSQRRPIIASRIIGR
jgi:hypothetical protein